MEMVAGRFGEYAAAVERFKHSVSGLLDRPQALPLFFRALMDGHQACWRLDAYARLVETYGVSGRDMLSVLSSTEACDRFRRVAFAPDVEELIHAALTDGEARRRELADLREEHLELESLIEDLQRLLESVSQSNKALEKISTTDELTGISNYRAFRVHLEDIWRQYQGNNAQVSLLKLNVDYYHEFNVCYGQETADRYLRQIAAMLSQQISHQSQMVARLHGAEFALLLPGVSCENARQIAHTIMQELAQKKIEHAKSPSGAYLTLSVGLGSQVVALGSSSRELLGRVDTALKLASERGRNRLEVLEG